MILHPVLDQSEIVQKIHVFHMILRPVLDSLKVVQRSNVFHVILRPALKHGRKLVKFTCFSCEHNKRVEKVQFATSGKVYSFLRGKAPFILVITTSIHSPLLDSHFSC